MSLIRTKLLPATRTKGTRIKAYYLGLSITIGYSYTGIPELSSNHRRAAIALLDRLKLPWLDWSIESEQLNNLEYVHIFKAPLEIPEFLKPQNY